MPLVQTRGAASAQGFGEFAQAGVANYIEDVFSCFLYTGTGAAQTITNNIDLSTKGGLTWIKGRSGATDHALYDTARGATFDIASNLSTAQTTQATGLTAFGTTGFSIGALAKLNTNAATYVSWTFRKQPKFFDVVTYTGTGSNRTIAHSLGSVPGSIIVKCSSHGVGWNVYHRSLTSAAYQLELNTTSAEFSDPTIWNSTAPTSTEFSVGTNLGINGSGRTYVAYLFAHDAGGFGLTGLDNVISCGGFTTDGSGLATVSLGYEPQWVLFKQTDGADSWYLNDIMRGMSVSAYSNNLSPNLSAAESAGGYDTKPTATGFNANPGIANKNYIYIAIRRGPMKVPETGTSVFSPAYASTNTSPTKITTGFPVDMQINSYLNGTGTNQPVLSRLQGVSSNTTESGVYLQTAATAAESPSPAYSLGWDNTGFRQFSYYDGAKSGFWNFGRAPGFFDVVCYTGTGSATTFSHNLTVVPELMIVKSRTVANSWLVYISALGPTKTLTLNAVSKEATSATAWNDTAPTASVFTLGSAAAINTAASTNVAYLFATLAGVSKVGNYTGTGATQTINCGFTGGARFVLIKRTDNPGAWYVWDTARGMVSGTDPSLRLNSTAAEVNANSVYTITTGFQIVTTVDDINTAGGEYIFFAIA